jgi:nucleoside-diphosphate-sugar epimerase
MGVSVRTFGVPKGVAWRAASAGDLVLRVLPGRATMTMMKPAVQFLANPNPFVSEKAKRELGWEPVVPAAEAVERTGRWLAPA